MDADEILGLPRITTESVTRKVEKAVRDLILSGQIAPGARLVESQLAEELGVSRAPVREALQTLENEGLVLMVPKRGASVAQLTEGDLRELYTVRGVLEALAARLAASCASDDELRELVGIVAHMTAAAQTGDVDAMADDDLRFHQRIWELSGHGRLQRILLSMVAPIRMFLALNSRLYDNFIDNCLEHADLVDALRSRDGGRAALLMARHIEEAGQLNIAYLAEQTARPL